MGIEQDAKVVLRGDGSGAQNAFKQVGDAAGKAASVLNEFSNKHLAGLKAGMNSVSGVMSTVMGRFTMLAAAVAGGALVFKEGIDESVKFTKEVNELGKVLGVSASEATAWNIALGDIYQDSGALVGAVGRLNRVIAEDEEKITSLGIKTRDTSGHLRSQGEIFQDVTKHISGFKEGIDRNIEGARIFGKSWSDVAPLMKLTADSIEAAKVKAEELGMTVTQEGQERVSRYRAAMNDVGDVMLAVKNVIGQALLPIFARLGEWFAATGPTAVAVIRVAMQALATVVHGVMLVFQLLWDVLSAIADPIFTVGRALRAIVTGDFKTAQNELTNIFSNWGESLSGVWDRVKADSARTWSDVTNTWSKGTIAAPNVDGAEAGERSGKGKDKDKPLPSRAGEWANVLQEQKKAYADGMALQGVFTEWGLKEDSRYWAGILERHDLSVDERRAVEGKWLTAEGAIRKSSAAARLADLQVQIDGAKDNYARRDELAAQYTAQVGQLHGLESKQYADALKNQLQIAREHQDKLRDIQRLYIEAARADKEQTIIESEAQAQLEVDLGVRTQQSMLQVKREGVQARLQIELDMLAEEQAAYAVGTLEYEQFEARKLAAKRKTKAEEGKVDREKVKLDADPAVNVMDTGVAAYGASLDAIVAKGRQAGADLGKIWRQAGLQMIHELTVKPLMEEAAGWAKRLMMQAGFLTQKKALEVTSAATTVGIEGTTGLASIGVSAARAAAGAYAAIAGIPIVGPVMAPIAAGVALAGVMALGKNLFSAEGGFDIPGGMNPIVQTHAREMILPAQYADVIRGMAEGGQGGAGRGGGGGDVILKGVSMPGNFFMVNRDQLVAAIKSAKRDFAL